jgi:hypothetical protein
VTSPASTCHFAQELPKQAVVLLLLLLLLGDGSGAGAALGPDSSCTTCSPRHGKDSITKFVEGVGNFEVNGVGVGRGPPWGLAAAAAPVNHKMANAASEIC